MGGAKAAQIGEDGMQELENAISAIEDLISADVFGYGSDEDRELNSVLSMLVDKLDEMKR